MQPFFSIVVVCLNPGEKLRSTLESIKRQTFLEYEVVIKDGGSDDGSLAAVWELFPEQAKECQKQQEAADKEGEQLPKVRLYREKDRGIYDAMNQAAKRAEGRYVYYLNCGDLFSEEEVLFHMADFIRKSAAYKAKLPGIYYGNIWERLTGQEVASNPQIDAFGCYRNVPCHQACFYSRELLLEHPFDTKYKVRADYEQFLWSFFAADHQKVTFAYLNMRIADYEGGGFSESAENRKRSAAEHKEITKKYMSPLKRITYRAILLLTLAPLRRALSKNEKTAGIYNKVKNGIYTGLRAGGKRKVKNEISREENLQKK